MSKVNHSVQIETIAVFLLILLWIYTAGSKLSEFREFRWEMYNQIFAQEVAQILIYLVPAAEMLAAILLFFSISRLFGLLLSVGMMAAFTLYIGLALLNVYHRMPCSCGGVLQAMGWKTHLYFNLMFTAVALTGLIYHYKRRRTVTKRVN